MQKYCWKVLFLLSYRDDVYLFRQQLSSTSIPPHVFSDSTDPFNRQPLAMAQVQPQTELRAAIQAWISERRAQRINSAQTGGMTA